MKDEKNSGLTELLAHLDQQAELHQELKPYLRETDYFPVLQHPLVYGVPYFELQNNFYNKQLQFKQSRCKEARRDKQFSLFINLHERPYRLDAFCEIEDEIDSDQKFWELLSFVYTDSENIWQNMDVWEDLLHSARQDRECFMDKEERNYLSTLPETLTVYRGFCHRGMEYGFSWTLKPDIAEWFARRFCDDTTPFVAKGTVEKKDIIGYLSGRNESEIVALPEDITIFQIDEL